MSKLEFKHIAPYLPYELNVYFGRDNVTGVLDFVKCSFDFPCTTSFENGIIDVPLQCLKPILRPISDLYKEINGKIGIVELAKIGTRQYTEGMNPKYNIELLPDDVSRSKAIVYCMKERSIEFMYDQISTYSFIAMEMYNETTIPVCNSLELLQYLFENQYDTFRLIDKGLAIDINTIHK